MKDEVIYKNSGLISKISSLAIIDGMLVSRILIYQFMFFGFILYI